jgi:hypothetical protein
MRNFWLILSVFWLWTCSGGGGDKTTGPEEPPIVINLTSLGGQAQKGPFNNGTAINIAELTNTLSPTGRNFSTAITDNTGRFSVANVELESPYVELRANGYYFNEVSNEISSGQLTLFALSDLTGKTSLNVNILTHLEKNRMVTLMSGDNPKTFAESKLQAQEEVLAVFDYSRADIPESELLDISQSGAANAKLLAMSAIIQGELTVGQMSQLLANMSTDIASDGTLDDTNLRSTLIENSKNLDIAEVRSHLEAHYSSLGVSANIADFETEVNQFLKPPVAQDISASTAEDTAINITLAGSDPEDESLTYTILEVNNATVTLNGNVANYTPNTNFYGTDTFTYYANDGTSDSNIATVTMTVSGEDDDPNTLDVTTTTDEDVTVDVTLSAEEYDGDSYSFAIISDVSNGATSLNGSVVTYTPNQDWNGEDTFTFEATDDAGRNMNVATATITVNPINDNPTMRDTTFTFVEDCPPVQDEEYCVDIDVLDFLFNDIDSMSGNASVTLNSEPQHGSLALQGARFLYNPNKDWYGEDVMTYVVNDGDGGVSNVASINLIATPVNDAPVANDVSASLDENRINGRYQPVTITLDATDVEEDDLTYSIVGSPTNGTLGSLDGTQIVYTPNQDYNGEDSFTYKANDGTVDSNTATVSITVNPINDAPTAIDVNKTMDEDGGTIDVETNYSDVDGDSDLTFTLVDAPSNGTATVGIPGTYTPNTNFNGTDTFTYTVSDAEYTSDPATVTITVNSVNDAPVASELNVTTNEDTAKEITLLGSDIDGDTLTYSITGQLGNGSISLDGDIATYTPNTNFNGTDTFTYVTNDGTNNSNTAIVTVNVTAVNDTPVASDISVSTNEDTAKTFNLVGTDIEGANDGGSHVVTYSIVSSPSNGSLSNIDAPTVNGASITYTPNANWNGTDTFTYKVNDDTIDSNTATVTITVAPINDAPITLDMSENIDEDNSINLLFEQGKIGFPTGGFAGTDVDDGADDGQNLTFYLLSLPANGNLFIDGSSVSVGDALNDISSTLDTNVLYTPNANWNGTDTFTFKANDGALDGNVGTVTVTVNPVDDAPVTTDISATTDENTAVNITLDATDVDGDNITYILVAEGNDGTASITNDILTYTPNQDWYGTTTLLYKANDGTDDSNTSTVTVTVNAGSFETTYGSDSNHETAGSITYTSDGGAVVIGYRYYTDWLVVKFDSAGNAEWEYTISSSEGPSQVIETIDEGIVIAGNSDNGKTIIKLDSSGNEVFSNSNLPGSGIYVLKEDSSGNIYTSGYESVNGTNSGSLTKLDSNGNLLWNKTYRKYSSNSEYVEAFVVHSDQSITAVGFGQNVSNNEWIFNVDSSGNASNMSFIDLDGGYPKNAELLSNGNIKIIVNNDKIVEVSTDFSIVSTVNLSSPDAGGSIGRLKPTSDGGFIGAGKLNDSSTSSVDDGFFIKYDSSGTAEITKNVATSLRDWFNSVDIIPSGGYYFAGWSKGDDSDWDFYLVKVDDQGNRIF